MGWYRKSFLPLVLFSLFVTILFQLGLQHTQFARETASDLCSKGPCPGGAQLRTSEPGRKRDLSAVPIDCRDDCSGIDWPRPCGCLQYYQFQSSPQRPEQLLNDGIGSKTASSTDERQQPEPPQSDPLARAATLVLSARYLRQPTKAPLHLRVPMVHRTTPVHPFAHLFKPNMPLAP